MYDLEERASPIIDAFIDTHDSPARTLNGIQNYLVQVNPDEASWQWAMWVCSELYEECEVINSSICFEQIEEALHRLVEKGDASKQACLLRVIYLQAVLDHRGLWDAFCDWKHGR